MKFNMSKKNSQPAASREDQDTLSRTFVNATPTPNPEPSAEPCALVPTYPTIEVDGMIYGPAQIRELTAALDRERVAGERVKELEMDAERIDWLDENMGYSGGGNGGYYSFFSPADLESGMLRAAIDAAMKGAQP